MTEITNKMLKELIFNKIKELGYKPYNVEYPNGYFIFDRGDDSVTHFQLKGHGMWKHWRFGLWANDWCASDEERQKMKERHDNGNWEQDPKVVQLFAQYETQIDKFKPSRSALLVEYDVDDIENYIEEPEKYPGMFHELESMLGMMCRHPLICYAEFCGYYAGYYKGSFLLEFLKYESRDKILNLQELLLTAWWLPYTKLKVWLSGKSKIIDSIELYDFEKDNPGWKTDYLYEVRYVFTKNATQEEECRWLNHWWHKERYGKFGYYDYVIKIDSCRKVGYDGQYSYTNE